MRKLDEQSVESDEKTNEANIKLQEAFYEDGHQVSNAPVYLNNNTPAIKITGNNK